MTPSSSFLTEKLSTLYPNITPGDIPLTDTMKCVSFMTRSTVYLSMINSAQLMWMVGQFSDAAGTEIEEACYRGFQNKLLKFCREVKERGNTVWLSPINEMFVNINDIYLMDVTPIIAHRPDGRYKFVYAGFDQGFVPRCENGGFMCDGTCCVSSHFSNQPLTHIRECRSIVVRLLQHQ